jgi:hypothetical protein
VNERAILGDAAQFEAGNTLDIALPGAAMKTEKGLDGAQTRLIRDGKTLSESRATRWTLPLPGPGVYRAEVYKGQRMWIVSAPIYVMPRS